MRSLSHSSSSSPLLPDSPFPSVSPHFHPPDTMNNSHADHDFHVDFKYEHWMVTEFERSFHYYEKRNFLRENLQIPVLINLVYIASVFGLRHVMQSRDPFSLKRLLVIWNIALAVFSIVGTLRVVPFVLSFLLKHGFHESCCVEPVVNGVYGCWCWLFILSKVPELGDTVFVVLRKQKLIFLHWFHHSSVLLFVWISNSDDFSIGGYFIAMNFMIHSLMYTYFAMKALGVRMPRVFAMVITLSQVVQMIFGLFLTIYAVNEKRNGRPCATSDLTSNVSLVLYGTYLILFLNFFVRSYAQYFNPRKTRLFQTFASISGKVLDQRNNNVNEKYD